MRPRGHSIVSGSSAPPPLPLPTSRRSKVFRKSVSEVNVLRVSQREGSKARTLPGAPRAPPGTESGAPPPPPESRGRWARPSPTPRTEPSRSAQTVAPRGGHARDIHPTEEGVQAQQ